MPASPTAIVAPGMQYLVGAREKMWTQPRPFIFEATPKRAWIGSGLRLTLLSLAVASAMLLPGILLT